MTTPAINRTINREDIDNILVTMGIKVGSLLKIKGTQKIFWIDGPKPNIVQSLTDEDEKVTKEYISGKNGWRCVHPGDILLFLGISPITVENDSTMLQEQYYVLKWLYNDAVLFWTLDMDGGKETTIENTFEIIEDFATG